MNNFPVHEPTDTMRWIQRDLDEKSDNYTLPVSVRVVCYRGKKYLVQPRNIRMPTERQKKDPEQVTIRTRLLSEIASAKQTAPQESTWYVGENDCKDEENPRLTFIANGATFTIDNTQKALGELETRVKRLFPIHVKKT